MPCQPIRLTPSNSPSHSVARSLAAVASLSQNRIARHCLNPLSKIREELRDRHIGKSFFIPAQCNVRPYRFPGIDVALHCSNYSTSTVAVMATRCWDHSNGISLTHFSSERFGCCLPSRIASVMSGAKKAKGMILLM